MKEVCDHCGQPVDRPVSENKAVWCKQCVHDDNTILNSVGLMDSDNEAMIIDPDSGELSLGITENVTKVNSIPKKNAVPGHINVPTDHIILELKVEPVQEKIDFNKYNSTLPGRRGSHS